jgi:hypothetical protein
MWIKGYSHPPQASHHKKMRIMAASCRHDPPDPLAIVAEQME